MEGGGGCVGSPGFQGREERAADQGQASGRGEGKGKAAAPAAARRYAASFPPQALVTVPITRSHCRTSPPASACMHAARAQRKRCSCACVWPCSQCCCFTGGLVGQRARGISHSTSHMVCIPSPWSAAHAATSVSEEDGSAPQASTRDAAARTRAAPAIARTSVTPATGAAAFSWEELDPCVAVGMGLALVVVVGA